MKRFFALCCAFVLLMTGFGLCEGEDCFSVGYAERPVRADLETDGTHYVAGYKNGLAADGILDDQYVKAVSILAPSGESVMLIVVDCVALSRSETRKAREALRDHGIENVHLISTHDHAGSDTLGLWGPNGQEGKNERFMECLRAAIVDAAVEAAESRAEGRLCFGSIDTKEAGIQEDTRLPAVFDSRLYRFRFVSNQTDLPAVNIVNYASHAESLDGSNRAVSADFPAVVAKELEAADGSKTVWIPGAIGGLIRTRFQTANRRANCEMTGKQIAALLLSIDNDEPLPPTLRLTARTLSLPCENPLFLLMRSLGILDSVSHTTLGKTYIDTETTLMELGGKKILMLPGEIFPELVYGDNTGFLPADPAKTLPPLTSVLGDDLIVFGLTDDEIGYIVAPENFLLNADRPYLDTVVDHNGENHYEETNSLGPETAPLLFEAVQSLAAKESEP